MAYRAYPSVRNLMLDAFRTSGSLYVRLFSQPVLENGLDSLANEISGGGYTGGVPVTFGAAVAGIIANTNSLQWVASASATLGNISHGLVCDAPTGAVTKGWPIEFNPSLLWQSGLPVNLAIGDLTLNAND